MILLFEINQRNRKMLHGPSLEVFLIKEIHEEEVLDKNGFFYMLKSWRRIQTMFP